MFCVRQYDAPINVQKKLFSFVKRTADKLFQQFIKAGQITSLIDEALILEQEKLLNQTFLWEEAVALS